jgi:hypothetical protein
MLALSPIVSAHAQSELPDAPVPQNEAPVNQTEVAGLRWREPSGPPVETAALVGAAGQQTFPPEGRQRQGPGMPGLQPNYVPEPRWCVSQACSVAEPLRSCCQPSDDLFSNYLRRYAVHIYTPRELGRIAIRAVIDPFNLLTIGGTSVLSVATDSHSPYGPGVMGWAKLSGVTLTEDMTGEFVGTFMIPSIDHQDPHYHRMPNASIPRRALHAAVQPFWTNSDTGRGMINYSTVVGSLIEEAVDVSYVPYQRVGWGASADRIATGWASAPIGNYVTEFVPDLASHINLRVVFLQRIINQVARENGGNP